MRLDPRNPDWYLVELAWADTLMGRYAEAVSLDERHLARYPNDAFSHWTLTLAYVELGRLDEARAQVAESCALVLSLRWRAKGVRKNTVSE